MIKVTVYIPTYNYAKYIDKAIKSVLVQTMEDWEMIIIDDGSTDNTTEVLEKYKGHDKITIIKQENKGLNVTNNIALRLSNGLYIMRLDADDYLDENALMVLSNILDSKPDVDLVYPDYYETDSHGEVTNLVRRKKIGEEVELLDLPAHGACTMFRKEVLVQIGGYYEAFNRQDGYELWLRFIRKHKPYNVNIPLFYYRQHPVSITKKKSILLEVRGKIKRDFVKNNLNGAVPVVLGIIPVTKHSVYHYGEPFQKLAGKPLIWFTINEARKSKLLNKIVLTTDDDEVIKYAEKFKNIDIILRPEQQSKHSTEMYEIIQHVLDEVKAKNQYIPEAVCTLYINTPLRTAKHIDRAIDTMAIFKVDSVVSIEEELAFCYQHGRYGLSPIEKSRKIRTERKGVFKENSAIYLSRTEVIEANEMVGEKVGHITMLPEESVKINSAFELWLAENIISSWNINKEN